MDNILRNKESNCLLTYGQQVIHMYPIFISFIQAIQDAKS